jgi:hypothetical protein
VPGYVTRAVKDLGVTYPVALDNKYAIWQGFNNQYWPAHYFIDGEGRIRHHHFGEGEYDQSEQVIQQLLREAGFKDVPGSIASPKAQGVQAAAAPDDPARSPETYLGYGRGANFAAGPVHPDEAANYTTPFPLSPNRWGFDGRWTIGEEKSVLDTAGGKLTFRFHARDVHLVLGPGEDGKPVRFKVTLDGQPPGENRGMDIDAAGQGTVTNQRLYQLLRLKPGASPDHTFAIEFQDPGVQAFAFTFG